MENKDFFDLVGYPMRSFLCVAVGQYLDLPPLPDMAVQVRRYATMKAMNDFYMSEDMVRTLAILDKAGVLDGEKATVNAAEIAAIIKIPTADDIAADIADRIANG